MQQFCYATDLQLCHLTLLSESVILNEALYTQAVILWRQKSTNIFFESRIQFFQQNKNSSCTYMQLASHPLSSCWAAASSYAQIFQTASRQMEYPCLIKVMSPQVGSHLYFSVIIDVAVSCY